MRFVARPILRSDLETGPPMISASPLLVCHLSGVVYRNPSSGAAANVSRSICRTLAYPQNELDPRAPIIFSRCGTDLMELVCGMVHVHALQMRMIRGLSSQARRHVDGRSCARTSAS